MATQLHLQLRQSAADDPADDDSNSSSNDDMTSDPQTSVSDNTAINNNRQDVHPATESEIPPVPVPKIIPTEAEKVLQEDHAESIQSTQSTAQSDSIAIAPKSLNSFDTLGVASKYAGRALAEWAQIVTECDSFFSRRRNEGVPCDKMVETPTLGVESFRK